MQMVGKVATTSVGVIVTILLTRYLGPAGFGAFTFVLVFVTMFGTVADWGMTLITIREASQNEEKASDIIGNTLVLRLILAIIAAIVAVGAIWIFPYSQQLRVLVSLASLTLIAVSIKTSFQIIFNVKLRMEKTAISDLSANLLILLIVVAVVYFNLGITGVVGAYIAGDVLSAIVAGILAWRFLPIRPNLMLPTMKYLFLESLPMGALLVTFTIYNRIDIVILSYFQGTVAVGLYGAAYRIFEVLVLGAAFFANAVLPLISSLANTDRVKLGLVYRKSFVILTILGVGVAAANFLFAPLAIAIIGGPKFAGAVMPLQILSLSLIVSYFNHLNGYTLIALEKQWYSFATAIVALIINVTLNFIFIPRFSYNAAAFITFLTEGLIVIISLIMLRKIANIKFTLSDYPNVIKEFIQKRGKIYDF